MTPNIDTILDGLQTARQARSSARERAQALADAGDIAGSVQADQEASEQDRLVLRLKESLTKAAEPEKARLEAEFQEKATNLIEEHRRLIDRIAKEYKELETPFLKAFAAAKKNPWIRQQYELRYRGMPLETLKAVANQNPPTGLKEMQEDLQKKILLLENFIKTNLETPE